MTTVIELPPIEAGAQLEDLLVGVRTTWNGSADVVVQVVDIFGNVHATLPLASCGPITDKLNDMSEWSITFPKGAYTRDDVHVFTDDTGFGDLHEIQVYQGGDLLAWGPVISAEANSSNGDVTLQCRSVDWYLLRRFLNGQRTDIIRNGGFEDGLDEWTVHPDLTATVITDRKLTGTKAVRLVNDTADTERSIHQASVAGPNRVGLLLTSVVQFYIEDYPNPEGHARSRKGLYVTAGPPGEIRKSNYYPIDIATPRNQWIRAKATVWVPPNEVWEINHHFVMPEGTIVIDEYRDVLPNSVSTAGISGSVDGEVDLSHIVKLYVRHVQREDIGFSDVNIGTKLATVGVTQAKHVQWYENVQFDQALGEYLERDDCFDYSMLLTPTTRRLQIHPGGRGVDRSDDPEFHFVYGEDGSRFIRYDFVEDGTACITRATVLSEYDGPEREEGEYVDASQVGGLILQDVRAARPGARLDSLLPTARSIVNSARRPPKVITATLKGVDLAHGIKVGDTIRLTVDDGWFQFDGPVRVVERQYTPRTQELACVCNAVVEEGS